MGMLFKLQLTQRTSTLPMGLGEADTLTAGGDCMFFLNCGYLLIECAFKTSPCSRCFVEQNI